MPVTGDHQYEYDGVRFGEGSPLEVLEVTGLEDLPDVRRDDQARARAHGRWTTPLYADERVITMAGQILSGDETLGALLDDLTRATALRDEEQPLEWQETGRGRSVVFARPTRRVIPHDLRRHHGFPTFAIEFVASDPRVYSAEAHSAVTGVGSVIGGLSFPHGFPHGFGAATAGTIPVDNVGTVPAPWTATLTGPLSSPRISLIGGGMLDLTGFVLPAGQTLEFDSQARTVLLNGTASRYGALATRSWFDLPPGSSLVQLSAVAGTGTLTLRWRSAWL